MPGNPLPEALITPGELRELANLFDTWTNNFHPLSPEAQDAEKTFNQKASAIYEQRIKTKLRSISEQQFKAKLRSECRRWLKNNNT
jgi:hypothetical protein